MRTTRRSGLAALAAAAAALFVLPGTARAADWCGPVATVDRPAVVGGNPVRVLYAVPADGADRSAEHAPRVSADVDDNDAWWRANDSARTPRFDLTPFACGLQVDLTLTRVTATAAELLPSDVRWDRLFDGLWRSGVDQTYTKYLVYYDGPVDEPRLCGEGGGLPSGGGMAVVYLQACTSIATSPTAAHELLHTFGALAEGGPNTCPESGGHVCDSTGDILYPFAQPVPLSSLVLDLNRDDYYGHGGTAFDVRNSAWLRRLDAQVALSVVLRGQGTVTSDAPGVSCAVSCSSEWDAGASVVLRAKPASGQRFVRWSGACTLETPTCDTTLDVAKQVTAHFAPARFRLALSVRGRGRIAGAGAACAVATCVRNVVSHRPVALRAAPAKGWRLRGWSGACQGAKATCRVPMAKASSVRATFVRVPAKR